MTPSQILSEIKTLDKLHIPYQSGALLKHRRRLVEFLNEFGYTIGWNKYELRKLPTICPAAPCPPLPGQ